MRILPRDGGGETIAQIKSGLSAYQKALYKCKKEGGYALFYVHGDSYPIYHAARTICDYRKIPAGWKPDTRSGIQWGLGGLKVHRRKEPPPVDPNKPKPKPTNELD